MASSSAADQPAALSCLHLFRSLGSEVGLALCGAAVQGVLQRSIRSRLSGEVDVDDLVDHVRKSLEFLNDVDPDLKEVIQQCYALAVRWCLGISAVFVLGTLITGFWVQEQGILVQSSEMRGDQGRSDRGVPAGDNWRRGRSNSPARAGGGEGNV